MLKQTIAFKDFNGADQERDLYFNLTEWELTEMQAESPAGIQEDMMAAVREKDLRKLLDFIKMLINRSYGERDGDGIHFNKTPEITQRFINSAMYSPLLLSLFQDEGARAQAFITGLMPADLVQRAIAQSQGQGNQARPSGISVPQDFKKKAEAGVAEAEPITTRIFENNEASEPEPSVWKDNEADSAFEAALDEVRHVGVVPNRDNTAFRVKEEPLDGLGNLVVDSDEAAAFAEFKRRRDAGEL